MHGRAVVEVADHQRKLPLAVSAGGRPNRGGVGVVDASSSGKRQCRCRQQVPGRSAVLKAGGADDTCARGAGLALDLHEPDLGAAVSRQIQPQSGGGNCHTQILGKLQPLHVGVPFIADGRPGPFPGDLDLDPVIGLHLHVLVGYGSFPAIIAVNDTQCATGLYLQAKVIVLVDIAKQDPGAGGLGQPQVSREFGGLPVRLIARKSEHGFIARGEAREADGILLLPGERRFIPLNEVPGVCQLSFGHRREVQPELLDRVWEVLCGQRLPGSLVATKLQAEAVFGARIRGVFHIETQPEWPGGLHRGGLVQCPSPTSVGIEVGIKIRANPECCLFEGLCLPGHPRGQRGGGCFRIRIAAAAQSHNGAHDGCTESGQQLPPLPGDNLQGGERSLRGAVCHGLPPAGDVRGSC